MEIINLVKELFQSVTCVCKAAVLGSTAPRFGRARRPTRLVSGERINQSTVNKKILVKFPLSDDKSQPFLAKHVSASMNFCWLYQSVRTNIYSLTSFSLFGPPHFKYLDTKYFSRREIDRDSKQTSDPSERENLPGNFSMLRRVKHAVFCNDTSIEFSVAFHCSGTFVSQLFRWFARWKSGVRGFRSS